MSGFEQRHFVCARQKQIKDYGIGFGELKGELLLHQWEKKESNQILFYLRFRAFAAKYIKTALFCVITQRVVVFLNDVSGKPIGTIIMDQESNFFNS